MDAPTVDPREVDFYSRLAQQWWDESGKFWPLHRLNQLRVGYLSRAICQRFGRDQDSPDPLAGLSVLDIGCGGGILAESMARLGADVHAIDVVERNIEVAREHARQSGLSITYEQVDIEAVTERSVRYDIVLNMEVVEHVADLGRFMHFCNKLVDDNGLLFLATINRNLLSWLFAIVGAEYILRWLPRGTHQWRKFVKPSELESLLRQDGLTVTASTGVRVNPFTGHFSLSPGQRVNYMLTATHKHETGVPLAV